MVKGSINREGCDKLQIQVRYKVNKENPAYTFKGILNQKTNSSYSTVINGKTILIVIANSKLIIKPEKPEDLIVLSIGWSWGTNLAGNYKKISGSLGD